MTVRDSHDIGRTVYPVPTTTGGCGDTPTTVTPASRQLPTHATFSEEDRVQSFDHLIRTHQDRIFHYCAKILGQPIGEEVAQDVFLTAWQNFSTFRHESRIEQWLIGIARNKCRKALRNRRRREQIFQHLVQEIRLSVYRNAPDALSDKIEAQNQIEQLTKGLGKLRAKDHLVLNLRYAKGLTTQEIANIMGKSDAAVRQQLARALRRLREAVIYGSR